MRLNPSEISELIKSKIQNLQATSEVRNAGHRGFRDRRYLPCAWPETSCRAKCWNSRTTPTAWR